jgi:ABC-2 type transport system permease protein
MIAAILRAQFLSLRMAGRRGAILSVITGIVWYGLWTATAIAVWFAVSRAQADWLRTFLPLGLLGICVYWQAMPILSASMGSSLDMRKLLIYPAPHRKLFFVETLLRLTTGMEMVMVLAGGAAGLLSNRAGGGCRASPRMLAAVAIYILFNLLLASGTRSLLVRLLSRRKVRELLVFFLLILWTVPRFLLMTGHFRADRLHGVAGAIQSVGWPWTAAAHVALGDSSAHSTGDSTGGSTALAFLSICCWTVLAGWFGRTQFERGLRFDAVAAQATPLRSGSTRWQSLAEIFYRFPGLVFRDPLAAIVEKELRSLSRTPRYRMVFVMGFSFGLMVWLPMILGSRAGRPSALSSHFLTVICVYALTLMGQVSYWNCFGFDRSAAQIYFAAPPPLSATLAGKNIASLVFIYLEVAILVVVTAALRVSFGYVQVLETLVVVGICSLYMMALGNISSVQYPRALNPVQVSQGGASSRFQALIFLLYPVSLIPVFLAYLARYAFNSEIVFSLVLAFAAVIGGVVYWIAMDSAVHAAIARRENIIQDLSQGEGPIASD